MTNKKSLRQFSVVTVGAICLSLGTIANANAATFTEIESNDTFGTAQFLEPHDGSITLNGSRVGDVSADFFRFFATAGDIITLAVNTPGGPTFANDPILGLFDPSGNNLFTDDDGGPGYDSLISNFTIASSGFYAAAVSGWADFQFIGGGSSDWNYELQVSGLTPSTSIPTPALLPGLIGMGVAAWRKRKGEALAEASSES